MRVCAPRPAWCRVGVLGVAALGLAGCFEASGTGQSVAVTPGGPNAATVVDPQSIEASSGPMTPTRARETCWMAIENDKKAPSDLEKRAKWVDQCVAAKLSGR